MKSYLRHNMMNMHQRRENAIKEREREETIKKLELIEKLMIEELTKKHPTILSINESDLRKSKNISLSSIEDKKVTDLNNILPVTKVYYTIYNYRDNKNNLIIYEGQYKKKTYNKIQHRYCYYELIDNYLIGIDGKINDGITIYDDTPITVDDIKKQFMKFYSIKNNSILVRNNSIVVRNNSIVVKNKNINIQNLVKIEPIKDDELKFKNINFNKLSEFKGYPSKYPHSKFVSNRPYYYTIDGIKDNNGNEKIFKETFNMYSHPLSKKYYLCSDNCIFGIEEKSLTDKSIYLVPKKVTFYKVY